LTTHNCFILGFNQSNCFISGLTNQNALFFQFDQLEEEEDEDDLSDSGPDTISVGSTPKPSLKPFFCSSRSDLLTMVNRAEICQALLLLFSLWNTGLETHF
jgi:hypothetical protein